MICVSLDRDDVMIVSDVERWTYFENLNAQNHDLIQIKSKSHGKKYMICVSLDQDVVIDDKRWAYFGNQARTHKIMIWSKSRPSHVEKIELPAFCWIRMMWWLWMMMKNELILRNPNVQKHGFIQIKSNLRGKKWMICVPLDHDDVIPNA